MILMNNDHDAFTRDRKNNAHPIPILCNLVVKVFVNNFLLSSKVVEG